MQSAGSPLASNRMQCCAPVVRSSWSGRCLKTEIILTWIKTIRNGCLICCVISEDVKESSVWLRRQASLMDAISNKRSAWMERKSLFFIGWLDVSLADDSRRISGNNNLSVEISNGCSAARGQEKIWRHKYKQQHQMECFPTAWIYLSGWGLKKNQNTKQKSEVDISHKMSFVCVMGTQAACVTSPCQTGRTKKQNSGPDSSLCVFWLSSCPVISRSQN